MGLFTMKYILANLMAKYILMTDLLDLGIGVMN